MSSSIVTNIPVVTTGTTKFTNISGSTAYLSTIRGNKDINIITNNLSFSLDPTAVQTGAYDSSFIIGGGFSAAPSFVTEIGSKIYYAGAGFTFYNNIQGLGGLVSLNDDSTKNTSFSPAAFNNSVTKILVTTGSKLVVSGSFTTYSGSTNNRIIRLNSDGTKDTTFVVGTAFNNQVNKVVAQSDNKLVVVGAFTTFTGSTNNRIIRLNTNGSKDSTYSIGVGFGATPATAAIQTDDKVIVGGSFTSYSGQTNNRIIRLNTNGFKDTTFATGTGFNSTVNDIAIDSGGKVYIVGAFTTFTGSTQNRIVRLNSNGSLDTTFVTGTGFDTSVTSILIDSNGKILVGGAFTQYNGTTVNAVVRLNTNGTIDGTFTAPTSLGNPSVNSIIQRSNGNYVIASNNLAATVSTGNRRKFVVELTSTGSYVNSLAIKNSGFIGTTPTINVLRSLSTGKILIGGNINIYDDNTTGGNGLIRINSDGTYDSTYTNFNFKTNNQVRDIQIISGETKILIAGAFTTYNSVTAQKLAKLNIDGTLDGSFTTTNSFNSDVYTVKQSSVLSTGKLYVGGNFTTVSGSTNPYIIRLNQNGKIDSTFNTSQLINDFNDGFTSFWQGPVTAIYEQTDGKVIITGTGGFELLDEGNITPGLQYDNNIAFRMNTGGTVDLTYGYPSGMSLTFNTQVLVSARQNDGHIVFGGDFSSFATAINGIGVTAVTVHNIIRLTSAGLFDTTFKNNVGTGFNGVVTSLSIDTDGGILVGGSFTSFNGHACNGFVKLNSDGTYNTNLVVGIGFPSNTTISSILPYRSEYLVSGSFSFYQNNLSTNLVLIGGGGSGYTINVPNGIKYTTDITANMSPFTLAPKIYVDNSISTLVTDAINGLKKVGTVIKLGGNLTGGTTIGLGTNNLTFTGTTGTLKYGSDLSAQYNVRSLVDKGFVTGLTISAITGATNGLRVTGRKLKLGGNLTGATTIGLGTNSLTFTATTATVKYGSDLSSNYTARSFADAGFVTGRTNSILTGVTNGLSVTNKIVRLGGTLNSNTSISGITNLNLGFNNLTLSTLNGSNLNFSNVISNVDTKLRNSIDGIVFAANTITVQPSDGKILLAGGPITNYNGYPIHGLARLNTNGVVDSTFNTGTGFDNGVNSVAIQSDGKILAGGTYTSFNGISRSGLARLNSNGSLDTTFIIGNGFNGNVNAVAVQSDGKIVVGGDFTQYSGSSKNRIIRLNSNGSIDSTFSIGSGFNIVVKAVAIQNDGKILVGGDFTLYSGATRNRFVRLNTDGTIDSTFSVGTAFNNSVNVITIQPSDNKILVGGAFVSYSGVTCNDIVRLNTNGFIDATFPTGAGKGFNNVVNSIVIQTDNKIVIGGAFTTYSGATKNSIVRLNTNGVIDAAFTIGTGFNDTVQSVAIQLDGKIVTIGNFVSYNGTTRDLIARLNSDGTLDTSIYNVINYEFNNSVYTISSQSDNKILLGGDFTSYSGTTRNRFIRLNSDTTIDSTFSIGTGFNNSVFASAIQSSDSKILVGGNFTTYSGATRNRIIRLNTTGTIDSAFTIGTGFDNNVIAIAVQSSDGKIVVGGDFATYSGATRNKIIRLNTNGTIDSAFTIGTGFNFGLSTIAIQSSDGKILAGGSFTSYSGATRNRIIRLNTNGIIDSTFTIGSGFNIPVQTIAVQPDGKILVGGGFTQYSGASYNRIIRLNANGSIDSTFSIGSGFNSTVYALNLQTDGKIIVTGNFTTYSGASYNRIIRLNANGTIDFTYNIGTGLSNAVNATVFQNDGTLLLGGSFTSYNTKVSNDFVRLSNISSFTLNNNYGFQYGGDYSSTFTSRSIPDIGYVTGTTYLSNITNDVKIETVGKGIYVKEGTNATSGLKTLTGGTAVVSTTKVTANSRIQLTSQVDGGTPGFLRVSARSAGTSFTITSSSGSDTSQVAWFIVEPA